MSVFDTTRFPTKVISFNIEMIENVSIFFVAFQRTQVNATIKSLRPILHTFNSYVSIIKLHHANLLALSMPCSFVAIIHCCATVYSAEIMCHPVGKFPLNEENMK